MLNGRKVKLMIRMASYDQNYEKEDRKITSYFRRDYVSLHTLTSLIWSTVGYACIMLLILAGWFDVLINTVSIVALLIIFFLVFAGYVTIVTVYAIKSEAYFAEKYKISKKRMNQYEKNLRRFLKICEKENE